MNAAPRASIALAVVAVCCAASAGADEASTPEEFYRAAIAQMTQAMASFAAADGLPGSSLAAEPALTATAAISSLAGPVGQTHQT